MAKISIIIPCFNVESFIDRCMQSIAAQTIGIENLEVILIDDASTDRTLERLRDWESRYPDQITVISYDENVRQGGARNRGLRRASAEYIGFVDADDWIEPDMYQMLYEKMQDRSCDVVRGKFVRHNRAGEADAQPQGVAHEDQEYHFTSIHGFYLEEYGPVGNYGEFGSICTGIFRRDRIIENECFFPEKLAYEDNYWTEILSLYIRSCYIVDRICYHYMTNPDSTVMKKNSDRHLERLEIEMMKLSRYKQLGVLQYPEFYQKIQGNFILLYYVNTLFLLFTRCDCVPAQTINHMIRTVQKEFPDWESGAYMESMNGLQRDTLQLLKRKEALSQEEVDAVVKTYLKRRNFVRGNFGELFRQIVRLWIANPLQMTVEEQAYFYKIRQDFTADAQEAQWVAEEMETLLNRCGLERKIYVYTFLMDVVKDAGYALALIRLLETEERISAETKYFLYGQIKSKVFLGKTANDVALKAALYRLLQKTVEEWKAKLPEKIRRIPRKDRNPHMALVITDQFLSLSHGPTKSALARCAAIKNMGIDVLLINTAEQMTKVGAINGFDFRFGNYIEEYAALDQVEWNGVEIPYFQCDRNMPNPEVLAYLLGVVWDLKPSFAVAIGGDGILVSLVNDMLPTLAVGMVPSDIGISLADYQTLGRKLEHRDRAYLQMIGRKESQILEHTFTSDLRGQQAVWTREEKGLPEGFVIAVVGARLTDELTDDFWDMAEAVCKQEAVTFLILGQFDKEREVMEKHSPLNGKVRFEGSVEEVLAYLELCDLYINPIRVGGGISCVEAMVKGLPVVTTAYGDVGLHAGKEFWVQDYAEMADMILRYQREPEFYHAQSEWARKRAMELLDTDREFSSVIQEFLRREYEEAGDDKGC